LLKQCFMAALVSQTIIGLCNTLFVLGDYNLTLSIFGFYACAHNSRSAYMCYIGLASVLSVIMDVIRLVLWQPALLGHSLGLMNSLENFYLMLLLFGVGIKVLGGILAILLLRKTKDLTVDSPKPSPMNQGRIETD